MISQNAERFIVPEKVLEHIGLTQGLTIADLGCGGGYLTMTAAKMVGENGRVYAVDIQKQLLENIKGRAKLDGFSNISTIWADLEIVGSTKIPDRECDIAMMANILFQTPQPALVMEEAKRVAKDDGKIVVIDWKAVDIPLGPQVGKRIEKATVLDLAAKQGFKLVEEFDASQFNYGLIFLK
jgi:ubiquinone/menaquinone biosynthesis C-methylase UbiE